MRVSGAGAHGEINARIRAKVEYPFHVVKNRLRHRKPPYRGLLKNTAQLLTHWYGQSGAGSTLDADGRTHPISPIRLQNCHFIVSSLSAPVAHDLS